MKTIKPVMLTALSVALTACGGGGGSSGAPSASPAATSEPIAVTKLPVSSQTAQDSNKPEEPQTSRSTEEPTREEPKAVEKAKADSIWGGNFAHSKDEIPVYYLVENPNAIYDHDPYFSKKAGKIALTQKKYNFDPDNNYRFYLLDENAYFGFYRDSDEKNAQLSVPRLVYSFVDSAENKGDLSQLSANYKGEFWYTTSSVPDVATRSSVQLQYQNGVATGEIHSLQGNGKLFDVKSLDSARELELTPASEWLDNSLDDLSPRNKAILNVHFVNGADGTPNKSLVGEGGNDLYRGVLGAEKQ